jgi:hypothetical protein
MPSPTWQSYCDDEWLSAYYLHSGMDRLRAENALPGNLPRPRRDRNANPATCSGRRRGESARRGPGRPRWVAQLLRDP